MDDKRISIIVPIYKVEHYLPECIESILSQSCNSFELILVDDGSPDRCGEICDYYATRDSRIIVIHKENGGRLSAWMAGLARASGEYVGSIDGDDYVDCDLIQRVNSVLGTYSPDIVVFGYKGVNDNKQIVSRYPIGVDEGYYNKEEIKRSILPSLINKGSYENRSCIYLSRINKFIKASLLRKNTCYYSCSIEYGEDNLWTIPNTITADSVFVMADYYPYNYRRNPTSITHSVNNDLWRKFIELDLFTIKLLENLKCEFMIDQVFCDFVFHAAITINNTIDSSSSFCEKVANIKEIINNEYVQKGVPLMKKNFLSSKERLNTMLIHCKQSFIIAILKSIQSTFKQRKLHLN